MHEWMILNQVGMSVLWKCSKCGSVHSAGRKPRGDLHTSFDINGQLISMSCRDRLY